VPTVSPGPKHKVAINGTAGYGTVRPVVWEDGGVYSPPPTRLCARQGALTSWLKSNADPARGTAS